MKQHYTRGERLRADSRRFNKSSLGRIANIDTDGEAKPFEAEHIIAVLNHCQEQEMARPSVSRPQDIIAELQRRMSNREIYLALTDNAIEDAMSESEFNYWYFFSLWWRRQLAWENHVLD